MTTISVVICAYTEDRYQQTITAVDSIRKQIDVNHNIIVIVDHNPALYKKLTAALPDAIVAEIRTHEDCPELEIRELNWRRTR